MLESYGRSFVRPSPRPARAGISRRTTEGKAKVARNPIKHGFFLARERWTPQQQRDFQETLAGLRDDFKANGSLQESCLRTIAEGALEFDFRDPADDYAERTLGLTMHQFAMNIIRGDRYKYVHFTKLPALFFDLASDPEEFVNRADDPRYFPMVLEHAQKMLSWRINHDEHLLTDIAHTNSGPNARRARRYRPHRAATCSAIMKG